MNTRAFAQVVLSALLVSHVVPATADDSKNVPQRMDAMMGVFKCSHLAEYLRNFEERDRLLMYGYRQGQEFLKAAKAADFEPIKKESGDWEVPIQRLLPKAPSTDFLLGWLYATARDYAFEDVYDDPPDAKTADEAGRIFAERKFREANCGLIGDNE